MEAVAAALAVHGALLAGMVLSSRPAASPTETPAITIELVRPAPAPDRSRPDRTKSTDARRPAPRLAVRPSTADDAPEPSPFAPGRDAAQGGESVSREALARALSGLTDCDPATLERLPEARRAGCRRRLAEAAARTGPLMDRGARLYDRMYAHAGIMADVRRAENDGERAACRARSNIDSSCPNLLPDNLPKDFKLPRD